MTSQDIPNSVGEDFTQQFTMLCRRLDFTRFHLLTVQLFLERMESSTLSPCPWLLTVSCNKFRVSNFILK